MIDKQEAVLRVQPQQLDQLLHPVFDAASLKTLTLLANGIDASPGAAVGRAVFTADEAVELGKSGPVILVRKETTPDDIHGMDVAKGILTARRRQVEPRGRGRARNGAPVHRRRRVDQHQRDAKSSFTVAVGGKTVTVKEGDWISHRRHQRERLSGPGENHVARSEARGYFAKLMDVGRRISRQIRRARQCRYSARRESRTHCLEPKASACAARSTCSSPKIAFRTCRR